METTLDIEQPGQLQSYLRDKGYIEPYENVEAIALSGGVSNRTVLVKRANGESWVVKQALEKLRVQADWYSSRERIHREGLGLRYLSQLTPAGTIPRLVFEDDQLHLLAMSAVPQPHYNWKQALLRGEIEPNYIKQFGRLLGLIHRYSTKRQAELEPLFAERSFFETLRLEPYYLFSAQKHPQTETFFETLITDTLALRLSLVHGDYSPKNILVYQNQLILLDHEVIHFGDPAFDLGFSLTHFLSKANYLPQNRQAFVNAARLYWKTYLQTLGDVWWRQDLEERAVRHTLACLLARVDGRSPLEYLSSSQQEAQRERVLRLIINRPASMTDLLTLF